MEAERGIGVGTWLLCRTGASLLGLPLQQIGEVMRPLPAEPVSGMPPFLKGISIIRGSPMAVIDAGRLVNGTDAPVGRLVTLRVGDRTVALEVEQVIGIRAIDADALNALPPLLHSAAAKAVEALHSLDGELLLLLNTARLVPDGLLDRLVAMTAAP